VEDPLIHAPSLALLQPRLCANLRFCAVDVWRALCPHVIRTPEWLRVV